MRRARVTAVAACLAVVNLAACERGPRGFAAGAGELIVLRPSDVHILGSSEAIAVVKDLELLGDGSVWVLNSVEPFFIGFGPDGRLLSAHGRSGGGPEELQFPSAFVTGGIHGEAWVFDFRRHSLVRVSEPGNTWSEIPLPRDSLPPGSLIGGRSLIGSTIRTARLADEIVVARTTGSMDSGILSYRLAALGADLLAVDPSTGSARRLVGLRNVLGGLTGEPALTEGGFPLWFRLWAVCGEDQLHVYDRFRNEMRRFGRDGAELDAIPLPPVRLTGVTPRQFALATFSLRAAEVTGAVGTELTRDDSTRVLNEIIENVKGDSQQLAKYLPRYVDFRCTGDGELWLRPYDVEVGDLRGGPTWLWIKPDGETQEVRLPDRFDPFRFTDEQIWGVQRDELDVASVAWISFPAIP